MCADADKARVERLLTELGARGTSGDRIYVTGGTSIIATLDAIEPELYRFPAIDAADLRRAVQAFVAGHSGLRDR